MNELYSTIRSIGSGVVMLLLAMAIVAFGMLSWTDARAEVEQTRHNLGSTNAITGANSYDGTAAVCVFCHTPHGGSTDAAVPLWNRTLNAPGSYTTYATLNSATLDGATAPVGSVSIACLSCHDGTQAMDVVLNLPGDPRCKLDCETGQVFAQQIRLPERLAVGIAFLPGRHIQHEHT